MAAQQISLAGTWRFAIDRNDAGITEKWFNKKLDDAIKLPGTMAENLKGDDVTLQTKWTGSIYDSSFFFRTSLAKYRRPGNVKVPFWLTPNKHYTGVAWYQKDVNIGKEWQNKKITLFLERSHIQTRVWVDDKEVGYNNSLVAPHEFDLTKMLSPGNHTITIRIDNTLKDVNVGPDSHSVTDHTQGNWNGIVGNMIVKASPLVHLYNVQVYPDIKNKLAKVSVTIVNDADKTASGKIVLSANSFNTKVAQVVSPASADDTVKAHDTAVYNVNLSLGDKMQLWDEFNPALYKLTVTLTTSNSLLPLGQGQQVQFGMREIKVNGTRLEVNGIPVHLRGTVNNCEFSSYRLCAYGCCLVGKAF